MNAVRRFSLAPTVLSAAPRRWPPVLVTVLVWVMLAGSATYWGLRWWGEAPQKTLPVQPVPTLSIDSARVASALGARAASSTSAAAPIAPALSSRFKLLGVVAGRQGRGAALISVDGQPARPYRVGATVTDGVRVLSLGTRFAEVGGDGSKVRLDMPAQSAAQNTAPGFVLPGPGVPAVASPAASNLPPSPAAPKIGRAHV